MLSSALTIFLIGLVSEQITQLMYRGTSGSTVGVETRPRALMISRNLPPLTGGMERLNLHAYLALRQQFHVAACGPAGFGTYMDSRRSLRGNQAVSVIKVSRRLPVARLAACTAIPTQARVCGERFDGTRRPCGSTVRRRTFRLLSARPGYRCGPSDLSPTFCSGNPQA
jgi:hypothetical protein